MYPASAGARLLLLLTPLLSATCSQAIIDNKQTSSVYLFSSTLPGRPASTGDGYTTLEDDEEENGAGQPSLTSSPASYLPKDANAIISSFLNIEEYEILRDGLEIPHQLIIGPSSSRGDGLQETAKPLVVVGEKLDEQASVEDYISQSTLEQFKHHSFTVTRSPDVRAWIGLANLYSDRLADKYGWVVMSEVDEADSAAAAVVLEGEDDPDTDLTKRFLLPGALNMDYAFDAAIQDEAYATFLKTMRDLAAVADGAYDKATLHLSGLKEIAKKFGPDSTEVKRAKEMLRLTLDSIISTYNGKIAFFLVPTFNLVGNLHSHKSLRRAASVDIFSTIPESQRHKKRSGFVNEAQVTPIVPTTAKCYDSAEAVKDATNSCSGHGSPISAKKIGFTSGNAPTCWVCRCQATTDDKGSKHYWSGEDCSKEDVSSQFFLIVGSTLLLLFVAVASVALLSKVGSEPLPSTLAAMGGNAGGHHKRD